MKRHSRGFTLLETTVALAIFGVAAMGALSGLMSARSQLKDGHMRQFKATLAEARLAQLMLARDNVISSPPVARQAYPTGLGVYPAVPYSVDTLPANAAPSNTNPWALDPGGAFFVMDGTGISYPTATPAGVTKCDDPMPRNLMCRELAFVTGLPSSGAIPAGATANTGTLWVRVWRSGDTRALTYATRAVFAQ